MLVSVIIGCGGPVNSVFVHRWRVGVRDEAAAATGLVLAGRPNFHAFYRFKSAL